MPQPKKSNTKNGISAKYTKILGEEWMEEVDKLDVEELTKIIVEASQNMSKVETERDADEKLKAAKEVYNELGAAYKDAMKYQNAKIKYALICLEGKGKV